MDGMGERTLVYSGGYRSRCDLNGREDARKSVRETEEEERRARITKLVKIVRIAVGMP